MHRVLLSLFVLLCLSSGALAQNVICATPPTGDSSNRCASTAFVQNAIAGSIILPSGQILVGNTLGFAQARAVSGGATLSNTGVLTLNLSAGPTVTGNLPLGNLPLGSSGYALLGNGASAPSYQGFTQSGAGAQTRTWQDKARDVFSVLDFGADRTGVADSTAAINAASLAASVAGGGNVYFPRGTYSVCGSSNIAIQGYSNVSFYGDGASATKIILSNGCNSNVFQISNPDGVSVISGVTIRGLEIDGNRTNQTIPGPGVHCIRAGAGGATNLWLEDLYVHDCQSYGIGLQRGTFTNVFASNIAIANTYEDGFDIKNENNLNSGIFLSNIRVTAPNIVASVSSGIDVRGRGVTLNGISVTGNTGSGPCIRFREDGVSPSGLGGTRSSLTNFYCSAPARATTVGIQINAEGVAVSNGSIEGTFSGVSVAAPNVAVSNVVTTDNTRGFEANNLGSPLIADNFSCVNCKAINATISGSTFGARIGQSGVVNNVSFTNSRFSGHARGIFVEANAVGTLLAGNVVTGNTTAIDNAAAGASRIFNNVGHNPIGASAIVVGASPFSYTAGASPESVCVMGGTVSGITIGGASVAAATGVCFMLAPQQVMAVTYAAAPTMSRNIQ